MSKSLAADPTKHRIRDLNDALRCQMRGGVWLFTVGVRSLPEETVLAAVRAVQGFDAFTSDNDPYGEHDFGAVEVDGTRFFWKIDCYDKALEFQSPDPADAAVTERVLTLMFASEY